jgi:polysaccharide pyruvyl transferase WcaK-like protein
MRPFTIGVLANAHSSNVGNGALLEGTLRVLREDLDREFRHFVIPWDEYSFERRAFDDQFLETVNTESDLFVVIGAVTFNGRPYYGRAGMRFDLDPVQMDRIRKPVVFYGLSYRHWGEGPYGHLDKLREALRYIDGRPDFLLGLRDDGTQTWLEGLIGFRLENAITIPDPAMFVPHRMPAFLPPKTNKELLISLNNEDEAMRFREPGALDRLLDAVAATIRRAVEHWDAEVTIANHYFDDLALVNPLLSRLPPWLAHMRIKSIGPAHISETQEFYGRYASADALISMRVHSMTPAVGMQIPLVVLQSQDRISDFVQKFGLQDHSLSISDPELASKLPSALDRMFEEGDSLRQALAPEVAVRRERLQSFNQTIKGLLER